MHFFIGLTSYELSGEPSTEKIISDRITCRFGSRGFDENQFAYLKRRSSTQAVLLLAEVIKTNVLSENCIGVVFFDFTDAFGSVNRTKLVYKLRDHFGISGKLLLKYTW